MSRVRLTFGGKCRVDIDNTVCELIECKIATDKRFKYLLTHLNDHHTSLVILSWA